jgi:hypothetical protein
MMKTAAILFCFFLAGCAQVQSTVTVFHTLPAKGDGQTITIWPADKSKVGTLEFKAYAEKLTQHLQAAGYTVIEGSAQNPSRYVAVFNYGIDDGTLVTSTYAIPQYGVTGYSGSTTTGTVSGFGNMANVTATTTYTPQYGVTGYSTGTETDRVFKRAIILDIYDVTKVKPGDSSPANAQVYDGKLTSAGSCGSIAGVIDPMLSALFEDFPGQSGRTHTVNVRLKGGGC